MKFSGYFGQNSTDLPVQKISFYNQTVDIKMLP